MTDNIITPVGRLVSGSLTEKKKTDWENKPIAEEDQRYEFGVAFRKDDPKMGEVFKYMQAVAMTQHGHLPAVLNFDINNYSWKVKDGDAPNKQGALNENTKGCWVFYYSTSYPPRTCDASNAQIDAAGVKRGYYVDLVMNAANNGKSGNQAGIYVNPEWVRLVAFGPEITGGVDAQTAFGGHAPASLPPGASPTPLPGSAPSQVMTGAAPGAGLPGSNPAGSSTQTASPSNGPAPAHDFVQNAAPGYQPPASGPLPGGAPGPR